VSRGRHVDVNIPQLERRLFTCERPRASATIALRNAWVLAMINVRPARYSTSKEGNALRSEARQHPAGSKMPSSDDEEVATFDRRDKILVLGDHSSVGAGGQESSRRPRPDLAPTCVKAAFPENGSRAPNDEGASSGARSQPSPGSAGMSVESISGLALLPRNEAVVLVVDLVESVRLMQLDEREAVQRWRAFVRRARDEILPRQGGRLVKSLGDGLMAEFESPSRAIAATLGLHELLAQVSADVADDQKMFLRAALHTTRVYVDDLDIYGSGVNLAARLATLAGPGETIVSATVRDGLTDGLDAQFEDLGDCYLKHVDGPVRAYRVGHAGIRPVMAARGDYSVSFQPTIAVVPFAMRAIKPELYSVGELIADGVIARLSRARHLRVISRLSTTAFRDREANVAELEAHLHASYVLSGSYSSNGDRLMVSWELADVRDHLVVSADHMQVQLGDLLELEGELVYTIAAAVHDSILNAEVARSLNRPLPSLESYALLLGGIQLLHRSSKRDFERSFELLTHLAEKHPRAAEPRVWQAKWYALRSVQGLTEDREHDTRAALACTAAALDHEPQNSFALARGESCGDPGRARRLQRQ
jgi:adenylate cyclase